MRFQRVIILHSLILLICHFDSLYEYVNSIKENNICRYSLFIYTLNSQQVICETFLHQNDKHYFKTDKEYLKYLNEFIDVKIFVIKAKSAKETFFFTKYFYMAMEK